MPLYCPDCSPCFREGGGFLLFAAVGLVLRAYSLPCLAVCFRLLTSEALWNRFQTGIKTEERRGTPGRYHHHVSSFTVSDQASIPQRRDDIMSELLFNRVWIDIPDGVRG